MLEKPKLAESELQARIRAEYGISLSELTFLPVGADRNTVAYRGDTAAGKAYFIKLRRGDFHEASAAVPALLSELGLREVIPPLATKDCRLWTKWDSYYVTLFPYITGHNGFERELTDRQWERFGAALRCLHDISMPRAQLVGIPREIFSSHWRDMVDEFLIAAPRTTHEDSVAARTAGWLSDKVVEIKDLLDRANRLAKVLAGRSLEFAPCHADMHGWNLLVSEDDDFYIIDWDTLLFAPKERDLMFIGGGLHGTGNAAREKEELFYRGYGPTSIDRAALAYYRCERIVEDVAAYCDQLLSTTEGGADREQSFRFLTSSFEPGGVADLAREADLE